LSDKQDSKVIENIDLKLNQITVEGEEKKRIEEKVMKVNQKNMVEKR
jgi:hypothetical protein